MVGRGRARGARARAAVGVLVTVAALTWCAGCGTGGTGVPTTPPASGSGSPTASPAASPSVTPHAVPSATTAAPAVPTTPPVPSATPSAAFRSTVGPVTAELAARMHRSWRAGCPVPLEDLRYVTVSHHTFEGTVATGELVVNADVADGLVTVLAELFDLGYPIRSMRLVDDFGADDDASMAADNTSAFNCRAVTYGTGWSEHAYGRALDLNPVENPYVLGDQVLPPAGRAFLDRPDAPGVLHDGDAVVLAFAAAGWRWGGAWTRPVDYQHFSVSGR